MEVQTRFRKEKKRKEEPQIISGFYNPNNYHIEKKEKPDIISLDLIGTKFFLNIVPYKNKNFRIELKDNQGNAKLIKKSVTKEELTKMFKFFEKLPASKKVTLNKLAKLTKEKLRA